MGNLKHLGWLLLYNLSVVKIQHNIDEYTKWAEDIQLLEGREWSPEEMVETFIKRIHIIPEWKPQFHSYNEVREIYREYTKGE